MGSTGIQNKKLLFEWSKDIPKETRDSVPLLKANYDVFMTALSVLSVDWLSGEVGSGQPTESWEKELIREVNKQINGEHPTEMDAETKRVYNALKEIKVPSHFRIVTSHRHWLQKSLSFCKKIGVTFSDDMDELIRIHDLSKYTHREVIGYAVMFGDGRETFRVLENEDEKHEWQLTLNSHYAANPHHPEYFGIPKRGQQQQNRMAGVDLYNSMAFLEESIIDMLASHGERTLANDKTFSVTKWMNINPKFLGRYEAEDRKEVEQILDRWKTLAIEYLSNAEHLHDMQGHFDDRVIII